MPYYSFKSKKNVFRFESFKTSLAQKWLTWLTSCWPTGCSSIWHCCRYACQLIIKYINFLEWINKHWKVLLNVSFTLNHFGLELSEIYCVYWPESTSQTADNTPQTLLLSRTHTHTHKLTLHFIPSALHSVLCFLASNVALLWVPAHVCVCVCISWGERLNDGY